MQSITGNWLILFKNLNYKVNIYREKLNIINQLNQHFNDTHK